MRKYSSDLEECMDEIRFLLKKYNCIICDQDGSEYWIYVKDEDTGKKEEL
jgi:hypothetical protein